MEPTLPDGCSITFDRSRRDRCEGGIYVVRTNGGLIVKRAVKSGGLGARERKSGGRIGAVAGGRGSRRGSGVDGADRDLGAAGGAGQQEQSWPRVRDQSPQSPAEPIIIR